MKNKRIPQQSYERFVKQLEVVTVFFMEEYKECRKEDLKCSNYSYKTGFDDGVLSMCKTFLEYIKEFKDENEKQSSNKSYLSQRSKR